MFIPHNLVFFSFLSSLGLGLCLLFSLIYSSPLQEHLVVHRRIDSIPKGFIQNGQPNSNDSIQLMFELAARNMDGLEKKLYDVSMPNSSHYGQHLTKEQVKEFVSPESNVTNTFNNWLSRHDIKPKTISYAGQHILLEIPVSKAEKLLNTTFFKYEHTSSNRSIARTTEYSVPQALQEYILFVHPTTTFPSDPTSLDSGLSRKVSSMAVQASTHSTARRSTCDPEQVTVNCIRERYNIPDNLGTGETVAIPLIGNTFAPTDIATYLKSNRADVKLSSIDLDIVSVNGGDLQPQLADDSTITISPQIVLGVMPSVKVALITAGTDISDINGLVTNTLNALNALLDMETPPTVVNYISVYPESLVSKELATSICQAFMALGTRGTTVVAASGEAGGVCSIGPVFPASCPNVLSVGATTLSSDSEVAANFSLGGFSDLFQMPSYQANVLGSYLNQIGTINAGRFDKTKRGYPDMSVLADNVVYLQNGEQVTSGNTEIAASVVAAMIGGLNSERQSQGKAPLGFLNPLLYTRPDLFADITQGSNLNCDDNGAFPVLPGWDPLTGLGVPDYNKWLTL